MRTNIKIKKVISSITISLLLLGIFPLNLNITNASNELVYPLKKISKLECRFNEFDTLGSECLEDLPILKTSDYKKYATQNGGYNKYTRLYTVLWGASYKYGWDVGYGGHMGVDIATAKGTPVYSMADGEVIKAQWGNAEGNYISIRHNINGKTIVSNYMHLSKLSVSKGDRVKAGELIGKVGSTGNSTGNHLHFQIDTKLDFSPIYYNYKTCPHSYYEITEKGVCFDELERITVDPLLFLETNGGILNSNVKVERLPKKNSTITNSTKKNNSSYSNKNNNSKVTVSILSNSSIFDRNVFIGSSFGDVREVQSIYKSLGYYNGEINGDYNDVLESVIKYQLDKKIIAQRGEAGTGNFGPKTRAQTKKDYNAFIKSGGKIATTFIPSNRNKDELNNNSKEEVTIIKIPDDSRVTIGKTEKISRKNLMTRKELEEKEVNDFLKDYTIDLNFNNAGGNVLLGDSEVLNLEVKNSRGRYFRGSMPGAMTFVTDRSKIGVFPEQLYFFTDGKREIKLTGLKEGVTNLYIKVGNVTVKTFKIRVYNGKKTITPDGIKILGENAFLGNTQTALGILKEGNTNLINLKYSGTYKLKASDGDKVCLKKGDFSDLKTVFRRKCNDLDFKDEINFTYNDTVGGILVFDYKSVNKNTKFELISQNGKNIGTKNVAVAEPKGLDKNYTYSKEVLASIKKGIATTGFKQGYFMQDRTINQADTIAWVKNALTNIKTNDANTKNEISSRLAELNLLGGKASEQKLLERADVLKIAHRYLVFDKNNTISINYRDLDEEQNQLANSIFNKNNTWKENTGVSYFRPKSLISRGETAYLLMKTIENGNRNNISLK